MVKSKRLSRGSLAVLLLALLLALSMVVGITGAWFTDKDSSAGQDLQFGTVSITSVTDSGIAVHNTVDTALDKLMPGSTVNGNVAIVYGGTAKAYIRYKVAFTGAGAEYLEGAAEEWQYTTSDDANLGALPVSFSVANSVGNVAQGLSVHMVVEVEALQQANTTGANNAEGAWSGVSIVEYTPAP